MRRRVAALRGDARGMSLVEATIILMVIAVLAAVVAPAAGAYIEQSRTAKAKKDVETIGSGITMLLRDTGMACLSFTGSSCANSTGRVELLVSGTTVNQNEPTVVASAFAASLGTASASNVNWAGGANAVAAASRDLIDNQLVANSVGYAVPSFTGGGGPRAGAGWRGAYVNGPVDLDPWGYTYQVNTLFLTTASNATDGTGTGQLRGGWTSDVMAISAGANGTIQTAFGATGGKGVGDDVVYVVQGGTW